MKFKRILFLILSFLIVMALFACVGGGGKKIDNVNGDTITALPDLTDYSSERKFYEVTPVEYTNTSQQESLLRARIDDKKDDEDPSVPVKIFTNCDPGDIIEAMSLAGLNFDKMDKTVKYLAGAESESIDLDAIVADGTWVDNDKWSFFDDWDYYEKLKDRVDENDSTDRDSDNLQRQKRKIMRQIYKIGLTGDEFARLVIEELKYAQKVTKDDMHLKDPNWQNEPYDDFVKSELSYDTLVYFKAFNDFSNNKAKTVQLYGYYYDYNKKAYDSTSDANFEKQLTYSHQKIYSDSEFLDYISIQRNNYINAYRYKDTFYRKFYQVHFQFQELLETYDISVYGIGAALTDASTKYSSEMKDGMEAGFAQQLILSDHLYVYSGNTAAMKSYNAANTAFERVKESGSEPNRDEKETLLNLEKLKIADYILTKMQDNQLSRVLQYHIKTYSGEMIRNIQSEKKDKKLEQNNLASIGGSPIYNQERKDSEVKIGRTEAIVAQLIRSYGNAAPQTRFSSATSADWKGIRPEVKAALEHNYKQYADGTAMKKAFDNLLIKKVWDCGGVDENDCRKGNGHLHCKELYDENHKISRFLKDYEVFLRYSVGQVVAEVYSMPSAGSSGSNTVYNLKTTAANNAVGTYTNGNNLENRNMPDDAAPINYIKTLDSLSLNSGLTLTEAMDRDHANKPDWLLGQEGKVLLPAETTDKGTDSAPARRYTYTFEGWYIDIELKYKIDEGEKIKYDMVLYPGYTVKVEVAAS